MQLITLELRGDSGRCPRYHSWDQEININNLIQNSLKSLENKMQKHCPYSRQLGQDELNEFQDKTTGKHYRKG